MSINVRSQGSANNNSSGPVGAPKASHVKEVLAGLRDRLEVQLDDENDHDPALVRAIRSNIRCQLEQINEALTRIEEGKYGVCSGCLTQINADRLVARPYSTLCIDCQGRQDRGMAAQ
jgi:DnaK suppressor protein